MIIVTKSNHNVSTHMYTDTTQTRSHTNVIVIIMIIVMKSICKYTHVRKYNTNTITQKSNSYNNDNIMIRRINIISYEW